MTGLSGGGRANGSIVVATVAALLTVALVGALVLSTGVGPPDVGQPDGTPAVTTATPVAAGGNGGSSGSGGSGGSGSSGGAGSNGNGGSGGASNGESNAQTPTPPPYDFDVLGTENCGNTCRDVTVRLTNNRDAMANDVVVTTRIYAGNTTEESARVWEGQRDVGTLEPDGSTTETERVSLSYFDALSVKQKGGWITIVTTVESQEITKRFEEQRKVA